MARLMTSILEGRPARRRTVPGTTAHRMKPLTTMAAVAMLRSRTALATRSTRPRTGPPGGSGSSKGHTKLSDMAQLYGRSGAAKGAAMVHADSMRLPPSPELLPVAEPP